MNKKIEGLPSSIVFSKSFLSFSKEIKEAIKFYKRANSPKVLFKLINDNNEGYNLATHGDIEKISYFPKEKEVLFFPFSAFEIKEIREISINNVRCYQINLLYLGKYLINNLKDEMTIPDSEFKMELFKSWLIEKDSVGKPNFLFEKYKEYKEGLKSKK